MKNIFIKDAISNLCPNVSFSIENGEIVTWGSDEIAQPSSSDVMAEATRLQAEFDAKEYARSRATEYPSIGDQLDALFHAGAFPDDMAAQIQAVKDKYPKE